MEESDPPDSPSVVKRPTPVEHHATHDVHVLSLDLLPAPESSNTSVFVRVRQVHLRQGALDWGPTNGAGDQSMSISVSVFFAFAQGTPLMPERG